MHISKTFSSVSSFIGLVKVTAPLLLEGVNVTLTAYQTENEDFSWI